VQRWPHASAGIGIFISVTASGIRLQLLQSTDTPVGTCVGYGDATHSFRANINNLLRYLNVRNI